MALPSREDVRNTARLYWRFTQVGPGPELEAFARGLSEEDYARLCQACTQALWTALPTEAIGLRLRLRHLHAVRSVGHLARPDPEDGLYLRKGTRFVLRRTVTRRKGSKGKKSSQME